MSRRHPVARIPAQRDGRIRTMRTLGPTDAGYDWEDGIPVCPLPLGWTAKGWRRAWRRACRAGLALPDAYPFHVVVHCPR